MSRRRVFSEVLEAAEHLDSDAHAALVAILTRRLAERGPERVTDTVRESRNEVAAGQCEVTNASDLIREAKCRGDGR